MLPPEEPLLDKALTVPVQHCIAAEPGHLPISVATEHFCVVVSIQVPVQPSLVTAAIAMPLKAGKIIIDMIARLNIFVFIILIIAHK